MEKQARARQQVEDKMIREEQQRLDHERMVSKMEQEELELIQRLQNTQLLQKAAYDDLENALGGSMMNESQQQQPRPGTAASSKGGKPGSKMGARR